MTVQDALSFIAVQHRLGLTPVQRGTEFRRFGFHPTPLGTMLRCHDERGYVYTFDPESLDRVLDFVPINAPAKPGDQIAAFHRDLRAAMRKAAKKHGFVSNSMNVEFADDGSTILGAARFVQVPHQGHGIGRGKLKVKKRAVRRARRKR